MAVREVIFEKKKVDPTKLRLVVLGLSMRSWCKPAFGLRPAWFKSFRVSGFAWFKFSVHNLIPLYGFILLFPPS